MHPWINVHIIIVTLIILIKIHLRSCFIRAKSLIFNNYNPFCFKVLYDQFKIYCIFVIIKRDEKILGSEVQDLLILLLDLCFSNCKSAMGLLFYTRIRIIYKSILLFLYDNTNTHMDLSILILDSEYFMWDLQDSSWSFHYTT